MRRLVGAYFTRSLSRLDLTDEAWFLQGEASTQEPLPRKGVGAEFQRQPGAPRAAEIDMGSPSTLWPGLKSWDGRTAIVDHDGSCYLIVRRTYYPGLDVSSQ